ncbi:hypothetical protein L873DRAFT_1804529 [Choiromyces venosus 120613-1]|uniref:Uncharacterized protein n=1 Tax=Choiromyces venosus 120613-1 TaxID=1336337 RepID=A0A3N4JXD0_9PEZI|nr:hypothetical protein L873DRAFT_1804529 [Choiromyces venosus 120613-1]
MANDIWCHAVKNARQARVTSDESDNPPLSLQELIASSALDVDPHPGRPRLLDTEDKDKLIEFVKKNFQTRRMMINDLCFELTSCMP